MSRFTNPVPQFYLNNGDIASSGKLYFYETGTTTKKDTFSNFGQTIKNTNPVILSGEGRCPNVFGNGRYTVVFKSFDDIEQWSRDDVELSVELGQYADWSAILTYRVNDIARGSDGEYYRSITSTNSGNDPTTSSTNWEQIGFLTYWNTNVTYSTDDLVIHDGNIWTALRETVGDEPGSSPLDWEQLSGAYSIQDVELGGDFNAGQSVTCSRTKDMVTITSNNQLFHASGVSAFSSPGAIPAEFRPSALVQAVFYISGAGASDVVSSVTVQSSGLLNVNYYKLSDGLAKTLTGTNISVSISYCKAL